MPRSLSNLYHPEHSPAVLIRNFTQQEATGRAIKFGTNVALPVSSKMNHDDYRFEFEDWIREQGEKAADSKPFVGDRPYRHFDARIKLSSLESNHSRVIPYLKDPSRMKHYSFLPFLRRDKKVRRFSKEYLAESDKSVTIAKQKLRPIMYAGHTDAVVYGFYAYILRKLYNEKLKDHGLHNVVIAYRKIPRPENPGRNKSNIDFANDIYKKLNSIETASLLCIDITNFFGSMEHELINTSWAELLGRQNLPDGHINVFKNITKYRYIMFNEALEAVGLGRIYKNRLHYYDDAEKSGRITNSKIYNQKINNTKLIRRNRHSRGIPQGSPISDVLANLYLLKFDEKLNNLISKYPNSLYKRYSDDIIVIVPMNKYSEVYQFIIDELQKIGLNVNPSKTELFLIDRTSGILKDATGLVVKGYSKNRQSIQYLGFEFDLSGIHIRSATIAKHYRKFKRKLKRTKNTINSERPNSSHKKKRNKYSYIDLAGKRIGGSRLKKQFGTVRKRVRNLRRKNDEKT